MKFGSVKKWGHRIEGCTLVLQTKGVGSLPTGSTMLEEIRQFIEIAALKGCIIHFNEKECKKCDLKEALSVFKKELYCWELKQQGVHPAVALDRSLKVQL
jgi:hypothetical protein